MWIVKLLEAVIYHEWPQKKKKRILGGCRWPLFWFRSCSNHLEENHYWCIYSEFCDQMSKTKNVMALRPSDPSAYMRPDQAENFAYQNISLFM